MPDHPNSFIEDDYRTFVEIVNWADVVFLLVDTREARWFPTVVAMAMGKLVINAAVGFESFVVMRHGLKTQSPETRLGCYFCSDIVSPQNVTPLPSPIPGSPNRYHTSLSAVLLIYILGRARIMQRWINSVQLLVLE